MIEDSMSFERAVEVLGGEMIPTKGEAKNGWDVTTLTVYHATQHVSSMDSILNPPSPRPDRTVSAMKWYGNRRG